MASNFKVINSNTIEGIVNGVKWKATRGGGLYIYGEINTHAKSVIKKKARAHFTKTKK